MGIEAIALDHERACGVEVVAMQNLEKHLGRYYDHNTSSKEMCYSIPKGYDAMAIRQKVAALFEQHGYKPLLTRNGLSD